MPSIAEPTFDAPTFEELSLDELTIDDEPSFRHVALYGDLKEALRRDRYKFRVLPESLSGRWDRALFLNLTFWGSDAGGDVLVDRHIPADVVAHVAWHHLVTKALYVSSSGERPTADALFLGESIASAFDVYLVGRLLGHAPQSSFLETQVPAMADAAADAGLDDEGFEALLAEIAHDPEAAFNDLRSLLFDTSRRLVRCASAAEALIVCHAADQHRFAALLHRFELSNWVLYARSYARPGLEPDPHVSSIDEALRTGDGALAWLTRSWLTREGHSG